MMSWLSQPSQTVGRAADRRSAGPKPTCRSAAPSGKQRQPGSRGKAAAGCRMCPSPAPAPTAEHRLQSPQRRNPLPGSRGSGPQSGPSYRKPAGSCREPDQTQPPHRSQQVGRHFYLKLVQQSCQI